MACSLLLHAPGVPPRRQALSGPRTAGGSQGDGLLLPGLPPAALRLEPCGAGVVVEAAAPGVRAAGRPLPPGGRRLLRPGERATVMEHAIEATAAPEDAGTRLRAANLIRQAARGELPPPGPHLLVLTGAAAGARLPLGADQVLGRGRTADVRLPDPGASRRHARLAITGGGALLEDLGAKNGVALNGVRIVGRRTLRAGDTIGIGETILALELPGGAPRPRAEGRPRPRRRPGPLAAAALLALAAAALALAGS